jgi:hypothetical protein
MSLLVRIFCWMIAQNGVEENEIKYRLLISKDKIIKYLE